MPDIQYIKVKIMDKKDNFKMSCYRTDDDHWHLILQNDVQNGNVIDIDFRWIINGLLRFEAIETRMVASKDGNSSTWEQALKDIDYLKLEISDALRSDLERDHGERRLAMRIIWHLISLQHDIEYQDSQEFSVADDCITHIAKANGNDVSYDAFNDKLEALNPVIDEKIDEFKIIMGYTEEDIRALRIVVD